jgi:hypothetical protein
LRPKASLASITLFGDTPLRISVSRLISCWHEPQVCSYSPALLEAVGVLHGEHERERRERPDAFDLSQELGFWVVLLGERLQLAIVLADALGERSAICSKMGSRAGRRASGMCSEALLWKLLAAHLGKR